MPSPFPGMDPWLENPNDWGDVHSTLIVLIREAVNAKLPDGYYAKAEHIVWVDPESTRQPDVGIYGPDQRPTNGNHDGLYARAGMLMLLADRVTEPWEEPYLEIFSVEGRRLVTAIELLSPSNKKPGSAGRIAYQQKQQELRLGDVHVVEIDLLRHGKHTTAVSLERLQPIAEVYDYHVCVTEVGSLPRYHVKPFRLAERLPTILIPLDPGVAPIEIDLQPLLDRTYDSGRYEMSTNYNKPCDPPLTEQQQTWAETILRDKGLLKTQ